jgi:uncharacterized paraquat-inducible protein A
MPDTDWDIAEGLDPEGPSAADLDRFGDELIPCPACKAQIYDQSEFCPRCGHVLEAPARTLPLWAVGLVVLLVGVLLMWML